MIAPNIATPTMTPPMIATVKVEFLNSRSGISAASFISFSMKMKAITPTAPMA